MSQTFIGNSNPSMANSFSSGLYFDSLSAFCCWGCRADNTAQTKHFSPSFCMLMIACFLFRLFGVLIKDNPLVGLYTAIDNTILSTRLMDHPDPFCMESAIRRINKSTCASNCSSYSSIRINVATSSLKIVSCSTSSPTLFLLTNVTCSVTYHLEPWCSTLWSFTLFLISLFAFVKLANETKRFQCFEFLRDGLTTQARSSAFVPLVPVGIA